MRTTIVTLVIALLCFLIWLFGRNVEAGPSIALASGLVAGALFGLVALGIVLVYKGTRVFNFMQGEFGTLGAYFMFMFVQDQGPLTGFITLNKWVAFPLAILCVMLIALILERIVMRPLLNAPRITLLVATIALALAFISLEILFFRIDPLTLPEMIAGASESGELRGFTWLDFAFSPQRILVVGVLLALGILLALFFSRTNLGLAVLATSQDSFATQVVGISVERMSRFIWVSAAALGALAGILYIPIAGALVPGVMTSNILIPAFTGAVLGGMTSLPGAFIGGIVIGVVQSMSSWVIGRAHLGERVIAEVIPGAEYISILVVLLTVLLIRPQGLVGREA
jgi:branched-chain amino acid transport system permease protein